MKKYKIVRTNGIECKDLIRGLTRKQAKFYVDIYNYAYVFSPDSVWYFKIVKYKKEA